MFNILKESSPENVVAAPVGAMFSRSGETFILKVGEKVSILDITKRRFALKYQNEIWYNSLTEDIIGFEQENETWIKTSGTGKTGWSFVSNRSLLAQPVAVQSLLINPSFEDGLNGWTVLYETGSGGEVYTYSGSINYPYEGAFTPPSGDHAVLTNQGGPTTSVLYQDFFVPHVVNNASISFYYAVYNTADFWAVGSNMDFVGLGGPPPNQFASIDIMNTVADPLSLTSLDGILVNFYTSQESDPLFSDYQKLTFDITSYLQDCLGQTMRFRVAQVDNMNALLVGLDDVILTIN
jgi:hypothetical protein